MMSGSGGAPPPQVGPSAVPPGLDEFRLRTGSEGSAMRGHGPSQRNPKRMATSPPQTDDVGLEPPPLSDGELQNMKSVLSGHDYNFAAINAVSRESVAKKKELEEVIAAYRKAVNKLMQAYIQIKAERDTTAKIWRMMRSGPRDDLDESLGSNIAGVVRETVSVAVGGALSEWHAVEAEKTKAMLTEVAASVGCHLENSVRRVIESSACFQVAPEERSAAGRSYAGVVRASEGGPVSRPDMRPARELQETIEVIPGKDLGDKFSDAQATCSAVLASIKPNEVGIKIDRVIKGRNKSVRIVAGRDELDRLKPMLSNLGMDVRHVDKLNPRLKVRDIPSDIDRSRFVGDLIKQNLEGIADDAVRLVYWSPARGQGGPSAVIEVPPDVRGKLLRQGRIYLGWSSCRVMDHLRILQCFRCLGFGHIAKNCQAAGDICGHCGDSHESRTCPKTGALRCHNCEKAKMSATNHSALNASVCPILQRRLGDKSRMIRY